MSDAQATLLLTRPAGSSAAFLAALEAAKGARVPVVTSPLFEIVDVGPVPDLSGYATVVVTSRNAVKRLGAAGVLRGKSVVCVGDTTAELARTFGAEAEALGADIQGFLARADQLDAPCLYCRGVHSVGDIAHALNALGKVTDEAVIYDQRSQPLSGAAHGLLSGDAPVIAPVFSPRSADLLQSSRTISAPMTIIAISPAVAEAWTLGGNIRVAKEPNLAAMVEATIREI